jgi:hypothetical protein
MVTLVSSESLLVREHLRTALWMSDQIHSLAYLGTTDVKKNGRCCIGMHARFLKFINALLIFVLLS